MSTKDDKSPNLDVIRAIAVMLVVVVHFCDSAGLPVPSHYHLPTLGHLGVLVFFVHTSLVLMFSLERLRSRASSRFAIGSFIARRIVRIYPLSIVAVLGSLVVLRATGQPMFSGRAIVSNLLLIQNLTGDFSTPGPLWSLPFELQMYLFLPALHLLARPSEGRPRGQVIFGVWCAATAVVLVASLRGWPIYQLIKFVPCFLPGVLAFAMWRSPRRLPSSTLLFYLALVGLALPTATAFGVKTTALAGPVCLGLGMLIPYCRDIQWARGRQISEVIARYSYGIYLLHQPCLDCIVRDNGFFATLPLAARLPIFAVVTALLARAAFEFVEEPAMRHGHRMIDKVLALPRTVPSC